VNPNTVILPCGAGRYFAKGMPSAQTLAGLFPAEYNSALHDRPTIQQFNNSTISKLRSQTLQILNPKSSFT